MQIRDWLAQLPKIELHLHLEGAIPYAALWELVQKYGGHPDLPDENALRRRLTYRDFPHFIETWMWKNQFLREYEDFEYIAAAVAHDLARQNINYAEVFYSPRDFAAAGLELAEITCAIRRGLQQADQVRIALVADLIRDLGPAEAEIQLDELNDVRDQGVVGIGIGGSEQRFPPEPFAAIFESARERGFRTSAHAGEAAGAESVWGAVQSLRADRIGHGTRAVEDPALMEQLAESQTPVELCPLSNVSTGVIESMAAHPIREFLRHGVPVCINTDDPRMFHNSLIDEFTALREHHDLTTGEIRQLLLSAIDMSWQNEADKMHHRKRLRASPAWIQEPSP